MINIILSYAINKVFPLDYYVNKFCNSTFGFLYGYLSNYLSINVIIRMNNLLNWRKTLLLLCYNYNERIKQN